MSTAEKTAPKAAAPKKPAFPRTVLIVNETAVDYVIGRKFAPKGEQTKVEVKNEDEIVRLKSDCAQIVVLNPSYKGVEDKPDALRVTEAE